MSIDCYKYNLKFIADIIIISKNYEKKEKKKEKKKEIIFIKKLK